MVAMVVETVGPTDSEKIRLTQRRRGTERTAFRDSASLRETLLSGLIAQLLAAVEHLHAHGIIHRDIKPSNVWLMDDGTVKLIDFSAAAERGARSSLAGYEDVRVGTLPYSAPEQILDPATATWEAADIYSLGVVLYELLTNEIPFPMRDDEDEEAYRARIPFEEPVPPREYRPALPVEVEAVILKALRRDPAARHTSVAELRDELEAAFRATDAAAASGPVYASEPAGRRAALLLLPLAAVLAWLFLTA